MPNEVSYYIEFSEKFIKYLRGYYSEDVQIVYEVDNRLDVIVRNLQERSQLKIWPEGEYIPKLKVDIVFLIYNESVLKLILIEAKLLDKLTLMNYSQLVGYLQVGKSVHIGLLLLIQKGMSTSKLSNEFQEIIRLKKLPMDWLVEFNNKETADFRTGILVYQPGNGIDWIDTSEGNGISSFEELIN